MRAGAIPIARRFPTSIRTCSAKRSITEKPSTTFSAFHKILTGRFPEQRLLSHDLIEGAHVGVGLATDVELFEQFPYDYTSYSKRQHRWIRGDWQIASWILPRVPDGRPQDARAESADTDQSLEDLRQSSPQPAGSGVITVPDLQLELQRRSRGRQHTGGRWFSWFLFSFSCCSGWRNDGEGTCAPCTKPAAI